METASLRRYYPVQVIRVDEKHLSAFRTPSVLYLFLTVPTIAS